MDQIPSAHLSPSVALAGQLLVFLFLLGRWECYSTPELPQELYFPDPSWSGLTPQAQRVRRS